MVLEPSCGGGWAGGSLVGLWDRGLVGWWVSWWVAALWASRRRSGGPMGSGLVSAWWWPGLPAGQQPGGMAA
jgi:hypothetical protein